MPVTSQYLLEGAAYALEQCGLLLRDANALYRSGSYASAVVMAAFAREELGRSSILFDFRRRTQGGETFTIEVMCDACEDHVTKQRAGMLSTVLQADRDSGLGRIMSARMTNHPQSEAWRKADVELKQITGIKKKRVPTDRHEKRIAALYVEPMGDTGWNRPSTASAREAHDFLQDAVNDYAGRYHQGYITSGASMLKHIDLELYNALEQWPGRPELTEPEWPIYPSNQGDAVVNGQSKTGLSASDNLLNRAAINDADKKNILLKEMDLLQKVFDKYDGWIFRLRAGCLTAVAALVSLRTQHPPLAILAIVLVIMAFIVEGMIRWDHWYGYVERYNVIRRFLNGLDGEEALYVYDLKNYRDQSSRRSSLSRESVRSSFLKMEVIMFYGFVLVFWAFLLALV